MSQKREKHCGRTYWFSEINGYMHKCSNVLSDGQRVCDECEEMIKNHIRKPKVRFYKRTVKKKEFYISKFNSDMGVTL